MKEVTLSSGIKKQFGSVTVDEVKDHLFKSSLKQAQLRQVITSVYPAAKAGNSLSGSLFAESEFNFGDGQKFDENRVTWIDVPTNVTVKEVEERLAKLPNACLQKHLSSKPILSEEQIRVIESGINSKEGFVTGDEILHKIERSQRVRNREEELIDAEGEIIFEDSEGNVAEEDQHRIQYKLIVFQPEYAPDIDNRVKHTERITVTNPVPVEEAVKASTTEQF